SFSEDFLCAKRVRWSGVYLHGLLRGGKRSSIGPTTGRISLLAYLKGQDREQVLQQFVSPSAWDTPIRRSSAATQPGLPKPSPARKACLSSTTPRPQAGE